MKYDPSYSDFINNIENTHLISPEINHKIRKSFVQKRRKMFKKLVSQRNNCSFCQKILTFNRNHSGLVHDHKLSIGLGGKNDIDNLQILCFSCNQEKGKNELKVMKFIEKCAEWLDFK